MFVGQTICGAVVSLTVTVNEQELLFPLPSVAKETTTFVPSEKYEPEGGMLTTVTFGSHASIAVFVKVT